MGAQAFWRAPLVAAIVVTTVCVLAASGTVLAADPLNEQHFAATKWNVVQGDHRVSGPELSPLIAGKTLHFVFDAAGHNRGTVQFFADGRVHYIDKGAAPMDVTGTYKIFPDGLECYRFNPKAPTLCEIFVQNGGKLIKIDAMGDRFTATF